MYSKKDIKAFKWIIKQGGHLIPTFEKRPHSWWKPVSNGDKLAIKKRGKYNLKEWIEKPIALYPSSIGLLCVDDDREKDWSFDKRVKNLRKLTNQNGRILSITKSSSGKAHMWYKYTGDKLEQGWYKFPGIDVITHSKYVVLPEPHKLIQQIKLRWDYVNDVDIGSLLGRINHKYGKSESKPEVEESNNNSKWFDSWMTGDYVLKPDAPDSLKKKNITDLSVSKIIKEIIKSDNKIAIFYMKISENLWITPNDQIKHYKGKSINFNKPGYSSNSISKSAELIKQNSHLVEGMGILD